MIEAVITCCPGIERWEKVERAATARCSRAADDFAHQQPFGNLPAGAADMGDRLGPGELHRDEIRDRRPPPTQGSRYSRVGASPHKAAIIITAATTFAAAKKGASWAREISWTSFSGELANVDSLAGRCPSDSPSGRRAEIIRL